MTPDQVKYREAIEQLDALIAQIDQDDVDVDELADRVKEAVNLIRVCKAKIDKAELQVKQIVDDFAAENKDMDRSTKV